MPVDILMITIVGTADGARFVSGQKEVKLAEPPRAGGGARCHRPDAAADHRTPRPPDRVLVAWRLMSNSRRMATALLCRLGLHGWRKEFNEQGQMYRTCRRCGKDDDPGNRITGPRSYG